MTIRRETNLEIDIPMDKVDKYIEGALKNMGARIVARAPGLIQARKRMGFVSNGERIFVRYSAAGNERTRLQVTSENMISISMFDFGSNQRNLDRFCKQLRGLVKLADDLDLR